MHFLHKNSVLVLAVFSIMFIAHPVIAENRDFECEPVELLEKSTFTHVYCSNSITLNQAYTRHTIRYIAIRHTDLDKLSRFQDLASAALLCGGLVFKVRIPVEPVSGQVCAATNCREAIRFGIRRP